MSITESINRAISITRKNKKNTLLYDGFSQFLQSRIDTNKSAFTITSYTQTYKVLTKHIDEDTPVKEINEQTISALIAAFKKQEMKPVTINHYLRNFRAILNFFIDKKMMEPLTITLLTVQEPEIKSFTDEDIRKLLVKPRESENFTIHRVWTITILVLGTGIRASSVRHIQMQDLNLRNNTLYLQHTKNNKMQILNVSPTLAEALKDYIADYRDDAEPTEYLFPNGQNKQLTKDALVLSFGRFCKKRGTTRTSLHQLRHYFGLNYILNGGDSFTLQTILGHSSQAITKKYVSLNHENIKPHFLMYNPLENIKKRTTRKQSITKRQK